MLEPWVIKCKELCWLGLAQPDSTSGWIPGASLPPHWLAYLSQAQSSKFNRIKRPDGRKHICLGHCGITCAYGTRQTGTKFYLVCFLRVNHPHIQQVLISSSPVQCSLNFLCTSNFPGVRVPHWARHMLYQDMKEGDIQHVQNKAHWVS